MPPLLIISVVLFSIAMVFYTWGVWSERKQKYLMPKHVKLFACGVAADCLATLLSSIVIGGVVWTPHAIMGFVSLGLMAVHFVWSVIAIRQNKPDTLRRFHRLSLLVWSVWMVSYLSGFVLGLGKLA